MDNFTPHVRTDHESLRLVEISKIQRSDDTFSMEKLIEKHKEELDKVKPHGDFLFVIEDMSPRSKHIVVMKQRYYQFKGMIYAIGPKVKSKRLIVGEYVMWGLYHARKVPIVKEDNHISTLTSLGIHTYFLEENKVLCLIDKDARLTE